tara:strand:- start:10371 stop:11384 length:1014 start_codon:yes stop_codon:yes gene_type:complete
MSQAQNYFPSQNVEVFYQKEATPGSQPDDTGLTKLQTTSFSIPEASVPVEYSAQRAGHFTMTASQGHHSQGTKMWTFDTTLRGTPTSVLLATEAVFEDGSSEAALNNDYVFPTASYRVDSPSSANTFEIRFINGGADATNHNMVCQGCVATGFTLTQDIGSEGGELVCTISWATGFQPDYSGDDISSNSYDEGTPKNIRSLDNSATGINGGALEKLVIQSWELSVTRSIERISYADTTDGSFAPFGYAMVGGFEVTGSMTAIRNDDIHDLLAKFYDSNTVDINIAESSNFAIALDKCFLNEPSIDNGGAVLTETIPFTVVAADNVGSTVKMLGITIA